MSFIKNDSFKVLKIRDFTLFVLVRFFLTLAVQMQFSSIYLQIYYEYSKEEFILGLIGLAEAIPYISLSFYTGHFSDKHSKKKILKNGIAILIFAALILFLNSHHKINFLKSLGLPFLFASVFLFGCVRSFFGATTNPFISQLVPRELYTQASTWSVTAWRISCILGPIVAALIYSYNNQLNASWCHLTEIILLIISFFLILKIKNKGLADIENQKENFIESLKEGLGFVFKNKMLLSAISLDLFAVLFGGAIILIPAFTDKVLHLGPEAYGLLRTAPAIGAVLMAIVMVFFPPLKRAGRALIFSVIAFGVFTILFGMSTNYWIAFLMLALTGAFDNVSVVIRHSIIQLQTPANMRGRVSSINSIFIGSSNELGAFESGIAARLMGLVPSIIFGGGMTLLTVGAVNKLNPKLKKLDISELQ